MTSAFQFCYAKPEWMVALEGWQRAGLHHVPLPAERIGVVVAGHNLGGRYADEVRPRYATSPVHLPARYPLQFMDTDHVATVSHVLGVTGEGYTVGGASASGNVAIINGARLVSTGSVDACLVLGALTDLSEIAIADPAAFDAVIVEVKAALKL